MYLYGNRAFLGAARIFPERRTGATDKSRQLILRNEIASCKMQVQICILSWISIWGTRGMKICRRTSSTPTPIFEKLWMCCKFGLHAEMPGDGKGARREGHKTPVIPQVRGGEGRRCRGRREIRPSARPARPPSIKPSM